MKLLFNVNVSGDEELNARLGFIDQDVCYEDLERFIKSATRELIRLIGKETYYVLQGYYEVGVTDDNQEYVEAAQDAISVQAYRKYAPSKDVGHTQNGRRMRMDDHEKMPFEWMIDRDNRNMERMYYEALDNLLEVLESLPSWKSTPEYKNLKDLFVNTTQDFQSYFDINHSRLIMLKLQPGLKQCEQMQILPRIGKELFASLKEDASNNAELLEYIKCACVYWSLYWAFSGRLTVTLFPDGVLQRYTGERLTTQAIKPAMLNEPAWAAQEFKKDAEQYLIKIENALAPPEPLDENEADLLEGLNFDCDDKVIST